MKPEDNRIKILKKIEAVLSKSGLVFSYKINNEQLQLEITSELNKQTMKVDIISEEDLIRFEKIVDETFPTNNGKDA